MFFYGIWGKRAYLSLDSTRLPPPIDTRNTRYSLGGTAQVLFHTTLFPGFSVNILKCICLFCIKYLIFQRYLYNNKQHSFPLSVVCHLTPDQYKVDCLSVMRNRESEMENVLQRSKVYAEQTVHSDLFTLRKFLLVWFLSNFFGIRINGRVTL